MLKDPDRGDLQSRGVPELFALAFDQEREYGDLDQWPGSTWYAYQELQFRGTEDAFWAAKQALRADDPLERAVGADVLGQIGYREGGTFVEESVDLLIEAAGRDQSAVALRSIAHALGHRASPKGRQALFSLARHPSDEVRLAVATGIWAVVVKDADDVDDDPDAVTVLINLMRDPDEDVRNWATFGLGTQLSADGATIRAALRERLSDPHDETREEAVCGLANRRDEVAFEPLMEYLRSGFTGLGCINAAAIWGDPRFVEVLTAIRDTQPEMAAAANTAIESIRKDKPRPNGPGGGSDPA